MDAFLDSIFLEVMQRGYSVVGYGGDPGLVYTVGLTENFSHPELMMSGLDIRKQTAPILAGLCEIIKLGEVMTIGETAQITEWTDESLTELKVGAIPVEWRLLEDEEYRPDTWSFPIANLVAGYDVAVLRVMFPDESGIYPDEQGCAEWCLREQSPANWQYS